MGRELYIFRRLGSGFLSNAIEISGTSQSSEILISFNFIQYEYVS